MIYKTVRAGCVLALLLAGLLLGGCEALICPDEPRDPRPSGAYDFGFCD